MPKQVIEAIDLVDNEQKIVDCVGKENYELFVESCELYEEMR